MADVEFTSNIDEIQRMTNQQISQILTEWGLNAEGHAKKYCPVDTGNLRNSITFETDEEDGAMYVGTNVEYAEQVELNEKAHHETGQAHYLHDSIANHIDEYEKISQRILRSL